MKKLIILFILILILLSSYRLEDQNDWGMYIDMTSFQDDTVLYAFNGREFKADNFMITTIEVKYDELDASDATFSYGVSLFDNTFNAVDSTLFPFIMDYDSDTLNIPSARNTADTVVASKFFIIKDFPAKNFALWLDRGSVTSGGIYVRIKGYTN